ncbi:hypothetical protein OS493_026677 [Desmophyllum pertusum]|uniref:Formin-like protein n=1 Tax=Desmophyllum pertusum TaxID=174260 RepID=A0A9W9ZZ47_9CNID|nr:hypothetical protein OS493_026677 [Desmophyllum pertusum]
MFDSVRSSSSAVLSQSSSGGDDTEFDVDEELPDDEEIERRFSTLLEKMTLPPERAAELSKSPKAHKWKMIKAKELMQPKYSSGFYIEQLKTHRDISLNKTVTKKLLKGLEPVEMILRSLEVDLRTHPNTTWLREFIDDPYRGHIALIEFLQYLHLNQPSPEDEYVPKKKGKPDVLARDFVDEHLCLMCVRVLMRNKYGFQSVMSVEECLKSIILCLKIDSLKTQALVVKMLTQACMQSEYYDKVLDAVRFYARTTREPRTFETLVNLIYRRPISPQFQTLCLTFFNSLISISPTVNKKVFHQQEIEDAGFDVERLERALEGMEAGSVREALKIWQDNYIHVQGVMDEFVTLRERTKYLRDEVDLLQTKLEELQKENSKLKRQNTELDMRSEEYRLRATELQTTLENVVKQVKQEADQTELPDELVTSVTEAAAAVAPPPIPPPPPPPPPPPGLDGMLIPPPPPPPELDGTPSLRRRLAANKVRLPMLNWTPISSQSDASAFFKGISDEEVMEVLDFADFDRKFELKINEASEDLIAKKEQALKRAAEQITLIEPKRARNLVIARRRIQHSTETIGSFIDQCDLVELPPEHAELLLKFVPTKEELAGLARHANQYAKLAEAEQFLFEIAKVERYEAKLSVMAFIGVFDELMRTVMPQVDAVLRAATSIVNSGKLKKLFKIILIYGNYMNSSRRGLAYGFKLESLGKLEDTRSTDRKQTFLSYIADIVQRKFPELSDFSEELYLDGATTVSTQTLAADVQGLRKGLDLTKTERDKQPDNFIIFTFYNAAFKKVQRITERYRKMEEVYAQVCTLFGENPRVAEPSDFFKSFIDFTANFKKAERDLEGLKRQREAEAKVKHMLSNGESSKARVQVASAAANEGQRRSMYNKNNRFLVT